MRGVAVVVFALLALPSVSSAACVYPSSYPGDTAPKTQIAAWMAGGAIDSGLPGELPVMASLTDTNLQNLHSGDSDSVGYFQMRTAIWNNGAYAGYPEHPSVQLQWFIDQATKVRQQRVAQGNVDFGKDPAKWGEWVADVQLPASQYRYRYQLRLEDSRALIAQGCAAPDPEPTQPSDPTGGDTQPSEQPPPQQPSIPDAQLIPDSVLPVLKVAAQRFQSGASLGSLTAVASCANESCLLRAAASVAIPRRGIFRLTSVKPFEVKRGRKAALKLALPKKVRKLAAAALANRTCPLAAIRVVAANAGGYRISASRTVRLAPRARACR